MSVGFAVCNPRPEAGERRTARRWLDGFADTAKAVRKVGGRTRVVSVGDREADCLELFDAPRRHPRVELLVRAEFRGRQARPARDGRQGRLAEQLDRLTHHRRTQ